MADGVPIVGHAKGLVHYALGDDEGGHRAMRSSTRTCGMFFFQNEFFDSIPTLSLPF